jgi:cytochrome c-type biogenesis protein
LSLNIPQSMFTFTAGVFVLFSPCAFPMFPGYISLYIGTDATTKKAVEGGTVCALGLLTLFTAIGVVVSVIGSLAFTFIPHLELLVGLFMITMGLSMILEISMPTFLPSIRIQQRNKLLGIFLYGVAYGLATIGCSAPIFFSILMYTIMLGEPFQVLLTFVSYAAGMALPLVVITIVVVKSRDFLVRKFVRATSLLHRVGGVVLTLSGIYLTISYISFLFLA